MIPPVHKGIADFAGAYDYFLIDIWGVLHDGNNAYPGAADAMRYLKDRGKKALLLSNSPNRSSRVVQKVLRPIGIPDDTYDHILTSGEAAHDYMRDRHAGQRVYTFWDDEHPTALENLDVERVYDVRDADFIYASLLPYNSDAQPYEPILRQALERGLEIVCGNPDRVVVNSGSLHLCVGTLADTYEKQGGAVVWFGKPYTPIYDRAWDMLGKPDKSKMVAIGDSLLTDIVGAAGFGCDVVWNVEGIHWEELASADRIDPAKVKAVLEQSPAAPQGLMHGFTV
jgi:HAD superfamily hydrolase (TIGR01459 family)